MPWAAIQLLTKTWDLGSRAVSGSSSTSTFGSCSVAAMRATFCFIPFESVPNKASAFSSSEKVISASEILSRSRSSGTSLIFPRNLRNSLTVSPV